MHDLEGSGVTTIGPRAYNNIHMAHPIAVISKNIVQLPIFRIIKTHQLDLLLSGPSKHIDQITLDGDIYTSSLVTLEENEPWKFRRNWSMLGRDANGF